MDDERSGKLYQYLNRGWTINCRRKNFAMKGTIFGYCDISAISCLGGCIARQVTLEQDRHVDFLFCLPTHLRSVIIRLMTGRRYLYT